jgi:hypothetical protein
VLELEPLALVVEELVVVVAAEVVELADLELVDEDVDVAPVPPAPPTPTVPPHATRPGSAANAKQTEAPKKERSRFMVITPERMIP